MTAWCNSYCNCCNNDCSMFQPI